MDTCYECEIAFNTKTCPLCIEKDKVLELEKEIDTLVSNIKDLNKEIEDLSYVEKTT